ncbi:sec-independent protein translocase protein TatC [Natronocella acetinitrilica]|uniref:Sec-independent protein translocase protein TatC n=1 Tax=Natronocella acetinitrilica TaxID=414046 RepID=A0AAE3G0N7_9GAMM|nr:twin-arginine translocase subunit TatC [Natronocella acetinitrilica]MCP1673290.1 sec-independent protein translocase protein TatC [Natronocella acetinitrilica]
MSEDRPDLDEDKPFLSHLIELRTRLMWSVGVLLVVFLMIFPFYDTLFSVFSEPLRSVLPEGELQAIQVAGPFLIPMKLSLVAALFISIPYLLYQLWAFVAPGLYRHEQQLVWPLMISSSLLFYLGAAFAYFLVLPLVYAFFAGVTPLGVVYQPDIGEYLNFVLKMLIVFGLAFEVPIATVLLVRTGAATREDLAAKRPYVIVGTFAIAMLLTPPDIISQVLLAIPVWFLFELGLIFSRYFKKKEVPEEASS